MAVSKKAQEEANNSASGSSDHEKLAKNLLRKLQLTKGARYNADRRLYLKGHYSDLTISILSILVITFSLVIVIFIGQDASVTAKYLTLANLVLSSTILFLNIYESKKNYTMRAEKMRMSAHLISEIHNNLEADISLKNLDNERTLEYVRQYNKAIQQFQENHDNIDFLHFKFGQEPRWPERQDHLATEEDERQRKLEIYNREKKVYKYKKRKQRQMNTTQFFEIRATFFICAIILPTLILVGLHYAPIFVGTNALDQRAAVGATAAAQASE